MAEGKDGFLGRWSKRKVDSSQGKPLQEPVIEAAPPVVPPPVLPDASPQALPVSQTAEPLPELSLDDARLLTPESDFKPFMAGNVRPDVRNAAMKKLFTDPQFNVMDGLDIYIDDYSIFEPIPESMLRQMVSAKFLNLFDDEEPAKPAVVTGAEAASDGAIGPAAGDNAVSGDAASGEEPAGPPNLALADPATGDHSNLQALPNDAGATPLEHDHTDLRLQPDDAAAGTEAGRAT